MAKREGFQVPHTVVTPNDEDTWAVAEANDIKGGLHTVKTQEDLQKIPEERQDAGMVVYVEEEDKYYEKRGRDFVVRKEYVENQKPWTTGDTLHTDNYGATMIVPYIFMSNPKYQGTPEAEASEYSATGISSSDLIIDSKMNAYSIQELKTKAIEVDNKGFKLISKLAYDTLKNSELASGIEPFDAIKDMDVPAIIKPYQLKDGDHLHNQDVTRTSVDGVEHIVDAIVNVHVMNLKKMDEIKKNADGTYSAGEDFPLVFITANDDDTNVALGKDLRGASINTVTVGTEAAALGVSAVSLGYQAGAKSAGAVAVGEETVADGLETVALGAIAKALDSSAVAVGAKSAAVGNKSAAFGTGAAAVGAHSVVLGPDAKATGSDAVAIGNMNGKADGERSIAIGSSSKAEASAAMALGYGASAKEENAVAFGSGTEAMGKNSVALGFQSKTYDSEPNVISVGAQAFSGSPEVTRRIVHVAPGLNDTDAATKKQLDEVEAKIPEVPEDAKFTDTTYDLAVPQSEGDNGKDGLMSAKDKTKLDELQIIDYSQFQLKPAGDQFILKTVGDATYAPLQNDYLKESEMGEKFKEYALKSDIEAGAKKLLYSDAECTKPIYAKADSIITIADVQKEVTEQFDALMKVPSGGENSEMIDKYAVRDEIESIVNSAIEKYMSTHAISIDAKNQIHIGELSGDAQSTEEASGGTTTDTPSTPNDQGTTPATQE